uniref:TBC1 domain family member 7 n=1 Tax=Ditylenchus dipsaci TaxID=166011 RepID=A0A915DZ54_9BILA
MTRQVNFRANFLEKICSSAGVEFAESLSAEAARKVLEDQILKEESDVDLEKLAQFTLKYQIPANRRVAIWKILLGISSCYAEAKTLINQHRKEEADMLLRSLQVMRKTSIGLTDPPFHEDDLVSTVLAMIKLADSSVSLSALAYNNPISISQKSLSLIAKQVVRLCTNASPWVNDYWLTLSLNKILSTSFDDNPNHLTSLVNDVRLHINNLDKFMQQRVYDLKSQSSFGVPRTRFLSDQKPKPNRQQQDAEISGLDNFKWFDQITDEVVRLFFRSGGSSWLSSEPLYRLWDKIIIGEAAGSILKVALMELLTSLSQHISAGTLDTLVVENEFHIEHHLSHEMQLKIVGHAIESVFRTGMFK